MPFHTAVFESNLFQVLMTLLAGGGFYYIFCSLITAAQVNKNGMQTQEKALEKPLLYLVLFVTAILTTVFLVSFLFDLGETYQYSRWYKRSFGPFGDGFPFSLLLVLAFGFYLRSSATIVLALTLILVSGGRMVIASALLLMGFILIKSGIRFNKITVLKFVFLPFIFYFLALLISNQLIEDSVKQSIGQYVKALTGIENKPQGQGACRTYDNCIETQVGTPFRQRLTTSAAGLWMTLQGGYPGALYPGTPEKFADFMMTHNPFRLNDRFDLEWSDWQKAGAVQNPYLNVGSGYGPLGLTLCMLFYFCTSVVGYRQLRNRSDKKPFMALTVFFIFLSIVNQTQPWIQSGSLLLFLSGVAAAHIWITETLSRLRSASDV